MRRRSNATCFGAVILAAGFSRRMGQPKALMRWGSTTIIGHLIELYRGLSDQLSVVCRSGDTALREALDTAGLSRDDRIVNRDPSGDMYSSVCLAFSWEGWKPEITHFILALVDQPQIRPETIARLRDAALKSPESILQPAFAGRRHHPVVVPRGLATAITRNASFSTLRDALQFHRRAVLPLQEDDPGLIVDLDTPADYESARKRFLPDHP